MEASTNMLVTPMQDEHGPLSIPGFESIVTKPNTALFEVRRTDPFHFRWPKPHPVSQKASSEIVQSPAHTLLITRNLNNPQTVILPTSNSATTQHIIIPTQSHIYNPTVNYSTISNHAHILHKQLHHSANQSLSCVLTLQFS